MIALGWGGNAANQEEDTKYTARNFFSPHRKNVYNDSKIGIVLLFGGSSLSLKGILPPSWTPPLHPSLWGIFLDPTEGLNRFHHDPCTLCFVACACVTRTVILPDPKREFRFFYGGILFMAGKAPKKIVASFSKNFPAPPVVCPLL